MDRCNSLLIDVYSAHIRTCIHIMRYSTLRSSEQLKPISEAGWTFLNKNLHIIKSIDIQINKYILYILNEMLLTDSAFNYEYVAE